MAEVLLRARLAEVDPSVTVGSAGLLFDGRAAEPGAVAALARRGLDLGEHRAQTISAERLATASLVLAMEPRHVREVSVLDPSLFARTFTLPGFVARAELVGPRRGEDLAGWVAQVGEHDEAARYLTDDPAEIVADPMGRSNRAFRACADELDALLSRLVALTWPTPAAGSAAGGPRTTGGTHADRDRR